MNRKSGLIIALLFCVATSMYAQRPCLSNLPYFLNEKKIDTLYFPFYNGIQMIEIDYIGHWDKYIDFMESTEPIGPSYAISIPSPIGNEIFLRDTLGNIVKSYNTPCSLPTLNERFKSIPINQQFSSFRQPLQFNHANRLQLLDERWKGSGGSLHHVLFNGYYKVWNEKNDDNFYQKYGLSPRFFRYSKKE